MVDFLAKHADKAGPSANADAGPYCPGALQTAAAPGDIVVTDEFGRQRTVPAGSTQHKEASRKQREANALHTKIAQRQARVMGHRDGAGAGGHESPPSYA